MRIHNKKIFIERRKDLRNNSTPQEIILWLQLKDSNLGYKFRRQHSIGPYIVDFYCPEKKLVIEIDGSQHGEVDAKEYDEERDAYLDSLGLTVLRFWNSEVNNHLPVVLQKIKSCLGV
jgi:very-short-patch-repair endonuclease